MNGERPPGRLVRFSAVVVDFVTLLLPFLAGLAVAFAWLLVRSSAGRYDAETGDTLIAASLVGATIPAWTAWQGTRLYRLGATFGQARFGLAVDGAPWRRTLRLLAHPLSMPLWTWLVLTLLIAGAPPWWLLVPPLAWLALLIWGLAKVATDAWQERSWSAVLRGKPLPHDWLVKTQLARRP